jgi:AraC family transcriptional regulator, regulatory protein of adaptative response / methylated-DNA-[protein]-cysteine methyltransferase
MSAVDERWEIVQARRSDASFVFGVRTTRVACRPGCPARTPNPRNVEYFDDFAAAESAGYRACKRCAPNASDPRAERLRLVERACEHFARDEAATIDAVAAAVGLSRFHFQRVFRATAGITPAAYRRALRDRRFRELLARDASVTRAIQEAGFGSASRAYDSQVLGMVPNAYKRGGRGERLRYGCADSRLGRVLVAMSERGIAAIELGENDAETFAHLRRHFPHAQLDCAQPELMREIAAVVALVDHAQDGGSLRLDVRGTAFQRRIWEALRRVPRGKRISYAELAAAAGVPGAARAAAAACAANRLAVAIPCHRAVHRDGSASGYRWGDARKLALLAEEREGECHSSDSSMTQRAFSSTTKPVRSSITQGL